MLLTCERIMQVRMRGEYQRLKQSPAMPCRWLTRACGKRPNILPASCGYRQASLHCATVNTIVSCAGRTPTCVCCTRLSSWT